MWARSAAGHIPSSAATSRVVFMASSETETARSGTPPNAGRNLHNANAVKLGLKLGIPQNRPYARDSTPGLPRVIVAMKQAVKLGFTFAALALSRGGLAGAVLPHAPDRLAFHPDTPSAVACPPVSHGQAGKE